MNLIKKEDVVLRLPQQYQPFIKAIMSPTLGDCNRKENLRVIYAYIVESMALAGSQNITDSGALKFISENLYDEIFLRYRTIRHEEIRLAFRKGALKEYGDYFGFNVQTFYQFIKKYYESDELKRAKLEWNRLQDELDGITRSDKPIGSMDIPKESILSLFNEFKEGNPLPSFARVYYDSILKIKGVKTLINDNDIRGKIRNEAKEEYSNSLVEKGVKRKQPELYNVLMNSFDKESRTFESISKKIALRYYFNECIKEGKNVIE
jgi:hypothetical protein